MIRGAIFDVDGTILDSMPIWDTAAQRYLKTLGITADKELGEILFPMSLEEGAAYVKERFHLSYSVEKIVSDITGVVEDFYRFEAPLKEGVREVLEWLSGQQVKMAVATSGEKRLVEAAFERTGILQFFEGILTGADVGVGKTQPDIFYKAAQMTGSQPCETLVFEDAFHAIRTAREAGFIVIGVYDESDIGQNTLIREYSNLYCEKMNECIIKLQELLFTGTIPRSMLLGTEGTVIFRKQRGVENLKTALTIAGSDSSGGAGIQADIKTMIVNGVYAMSAITALTAQNTVGVTDIMEVTPEFLGAQLDNIFTDIRPDAVKIGMVSSTELIIKIGEKLREYQAENIVLDPVMVATSGSRLIREDAAQAMKKWLFPIAAVITPNIPEAEVIAEMKIISEEDMVMAGKKISEEFGCAVLLKGGHQVNDSNDLLYENGEARWFYGKRINNPNTHGTGCTLSSAIAANLAKGMTLDRAVERAKAYISGALEAMLDLGKGSGPMDHGFAVRGEFVK